MAFAIASLACAVVPAIGMASRNGPAFLSGVLLCPLGLVLAIPALTAARGPAVAIFGATAAFADGTGSVFFVWLFFVRGLC